MPDLRSRFLPVSFASLVDALAEEHQPARRQGFRDMVRELRRIVADEAQNLQLRLTELYDPFDRDSEVVHEPAPPRPARHRPKHARGEKAEAWRRFDEYQQRRAGQLAELCRCIEYLFDKANFDELPRERIDRLIETTRRYGLKMKARPERFEAVRVFGRGRHVQPKEKRLPRKLYRKQQYEVPSYSRLATVIKQPEQRFLQVYLYRNIDADRFTPLLPGGRIGVGWLDKLMMLAAGGGAITMALRLLPRAQELLGRAAGADAGRQPWWPMFVMLGVMALVGFKAIMSYKRSHDKYVRIITESMFDSSLDNNAGALSYLIRLMTKEESQEGLLAYAVGVTRLGGRCTRTELDAAVEQWVKNRFGVTGTNFQIGDAVETMSRLGMLVDDGRTLVLRPLAQVAEHMRVTRRDLATSNYHLDAIEAHHDRIARIDAGQFWICPGVGVDGEVCSHHNSTDDAYCDLCGWPRADGELTAEQEAAAGPDEPTLAPAPPARRTQTAAPPDPLLDTAARIVLGHQRGSVPLLQKELGVQFARASCLMDLLADAGVVGPYGGSHEREVRMTLRQWEQRTAAIAAPDAPAAAPPVDPGPADADLEAALEGLAPIHVPPIRPAADSKPRIEVDDPPGPPPVSIELGPEEDDAAGRPSDEQFIQAVQQARGGPVAARRPAAPAPSHAPAALPPIGADGPPDQQVEIVFVQEPAEAAKQPLDLYEETLDIAAGEPRPTADSRQPAEAEPPQPEPDVLLAPVEEPDDAPATVQSDALADLLAAMDEPEPPPESERKEEPGD